VVEIKSRKSTPPPAVFIVPFPTTPVEEEFHREKALPESPFPLPPLNCIDCCILLYPLASSWGLLWASSVSTLACSSELVWKFFFYLIKKIKSLPLFIIDILWFPHQVPLH
jgi:hypothetical protein